jgi:hypothetical protein
MKADTTTTDAVIERFLASPEAARLREEHQREIAARRRQLVAELAGLRAAHEPADRAARAKIDEATLGVEAATRILREAERALRDATHEQSVLSTEFDRRAGLIQAELRRTALPAIADFQRRLTEAEETARGRLWFLTERSANTGYFAADLGNHTEIAEALAVIRSVRTSAEQLQYEDLAADAIGRRLAEFWRTVQDAIGRIPRGDAAGVRTARERFLAAVQRAWARVTR